MAGKVWLVGVGQGSAGLGWQGMVRHGQAWQGRARHGAAGMVRLGMACWGWARLGWRGLAGRGSACLGTVCPGRVRQGKETQTPQSKLGWGVCVCQVFGVPKALNWGNIEPDKSDLPRNTRLILGCSCIVVITSSSVTMYEHSWLWRN